MKRFIFYSLLLGFLIFLNGCDSRHDIQPSGKSIKIGIIAPFSGSDLAKGKEGLKGMKAAKELEPYLGNGDGVELVFGDDKDDPALAVELLKKLVEKDQVSAIVTFSSSGSVLAMANVADTYKTPILSALAAHPGVTEKSVYVSQLCFDNDFQGTVSALFVRDELLIDKVALFFNPDSKYSSSLSDKFERKFKSIGGQITNRISLTEKTHDLAKIVKRVYDKFPELLCLPISAKNVIRVLKEVDKLGWKPEIMGSDGLFATILAQYKEELHMLDGMMATDLFSHTMPLTRYGKRLKDVYEGEGTSYAALGAEGFSLLLNAMNRCGNYTDRECINHMIRSTTNFPGVMGEISINPNGKAQRPLIVNAIHNGRTITVVKVQ